MKLLRLKAFIAAALRGSGQVVFMPNVWTGLLNFVALGWAAAVGALGWVVVGAAGLGLLVATAFAGCLAADRAALQQGVYGS